MEVRISAAEATTSLAQDVLDDLARIVGTDHVLVEVAALTEAGRDWWPLTLVWVHHGAQPSLPAAVVRPASTHEVALVLALANRRGIPVTPFAGRSGVCGGSLPVRGGISLDLRRLDSVVDIDTDNLTARVQAGVFGPAYESALHEVGMTCGHYPQSFDIATVGGWLACRGAGQLSNRYGKIEDIARAVEVVLADGRVLATNAQPRAATGPDLMRLFIGSEGTLGVITEATLQIWPRPPAVEKRAWTVGRMADGIEVLRRTLRVGAHPACLRLYDGPETARHFSLPDDRCAIVMLAEGEPDEIAWQTKVVHDVVGDTFDARAEDPKLVDDWLENRNDVSALGEVIERGIVVDTIEIAAPWTRLGPIYERVQRDVLAVDKALVCTAHSSHAYETGGCLYFTFAGMPEADPAAIDTFYDSCWEAAMAAVREGGGTISHHHGIGLVRARFLAGELGETAMEVLTSMKSALDPNGILNPDKLGLGDILWPGTGSASVEA